jgi:DNA-binding transcriptional LysR family regulator
MAYTFVHDVPGNARIYAQVSARIGEDMPPEFIAQVVHKLPDGLRHIEVWESRDAWERFQSERVAPAVDAVLAGLGITIEKHHAAVGPSLSPEGRHRAEPLG